MSRLFASCLLLGAAGLLGCYADIPGDVITSLPGWSGSTPTKQYSGYIDISDTKHMHYWFVLSANKPESDPVVLWLNGGPGCSSLDGYFNENGPLHFNRETADKLPLPQLMYNNYTWANITNMIFLESPVGVGFSYSDNPDVDYNTNDNKTALDNYRFLIEFFKHFPEYKEHDFYIAGESYAGIYIPTLVDTIRIMNQNATDNINLKGFMVGNGCVGNEVGGCGHETGLKIHVEFYRGHALFPNALYEEMLKECGDFMDPKERCTELLNEMSREIGKVNIYDIYQPCFADMGTSANRARNPLKNLLLKNVGEYTGPDGCIDDHVERKYFDTAEVRKAIHVASVEKIGGWHICTDRINYHANTASLLPIYPTLISTYRTMIFNGDVDGCVPFIGNEQWTSSLGFKVKEGWRAWMVFDQVAGYVTEYEENDFKFVTVKGSGHMVPQYRPVTAWAMFHRFINNLPI